MTVDADDVDDVGDGCATRTTVSRRSRRRRRASDAPDAGVDGAPDGRRVGPGYICTVPVERLQAAAASSEAVFSNRRSVSNAFGRTSATCRRAPAQEGRAGSRRTPRMRRGAHAC